MPSFTMPNECGDGLNRLLPNNLIQESSKIIFSNIVKCSYWCQKSLFLKLQIPTKSFWDIPLCFNRGLSNNSRIRISPENRFMHPWMLLSFLFSKHNSLSDVDVARYSKPSEEPKKGSVQILIWFSFIFIKTPLKSLMYSFGGVTQSIYLPSQTKSLVVDSECTLNNKNTMVIRWFLNFFILNFAYQYSVRLQTVWDKTGLFV